MSNVLPLPVGTGRGRAKTVGYQVNQRENISRTVEGRVKWFDPVRGFGFVLAEGGGKDILLHANVLRNFGQNSVAEGARVSLVVQSTDRGEQAIEVLQIERPEGGTIPLADFEEFTAEQIRDLPLEPARVKWFDKIKGFGFANVFGRAEDVFIHIEVLRASGLADLGPGEAVALRIVDGKRGRMASEVSAWEAAIK
ncbi:cold shock domain-containing protein [Pseudooceanicola sp. HF7]|nr:cold shock domain-containing protein [Pseudooceanicola sp. HF7]NIZ10315.1 cold shock domain-containing protein [Pseudooceanicola sp. HF7]